MTFEPDVTDPSEPATGRGFDSDVETLGEFIQRFGTDETMPDTEATTDQTPWRPGQPGLDPADGADDDPWAVEDPWQVDIPEGYVELPGVDTTWGDPADDAQFFLFQGYGTGTCGATSVGMIVADLAGMPFASNQEVVDRAVALDLIQYDPQNPGWANWGGWSGMTTGEVEALIESYGIGASTYSGQSVGTLATMLEAGHSIVLFVDGEEVWGADDDLIDGGRPNHFVQVTGVDYTEGVVYMNDPARPDGAGIAVPMATFAEAWDDSGNTMIVTDQAFSEQVAPVEATVVGGPGLTFADAGIIAPAQRASALLTFTFHPTQGIWIGPEEAST